MHVLDFHQNGKLWAQLILQHYNGGYILVVLTTDLLPEEDPSYASSSSAPRTSVKLDMSYRNLTLHQSISAAKRVTLHSHIKDKKSD